MEPLIHFLGIKFIISIIVIINPLSKLIIFDHMATGLSEKERIAVAVKAGITILLALLCITWGGIQLLQILNINLWAFEIAGGLIIGYYGWGMLFNPTVSTNQNSVKTFAISPFAIPITVGPGVITLLLTAVHHNNAVNHLLWYSFIIIFLTIGLTLLFVFSKTILNFLGQTTVHAAGKILGIIVFTIGIEIAFSGLRTFLKTLS